MEDVTIGEGANIFRDNMSNPSKATTFPDDRGTAPQTTTEGSIQAVTAGPAVAVDQQLANIASELHDVKTNVEKLVEKLDKRMDELEAKVDTKHQEITDFLRDFMMEIWSRF